MGQTLSGKLLLAGPGLRHPAFVKSVIWIAQHSPERGALGLILNRPLERTLGELPMEPHFEPLADLPLHSGGPVEEQSLSLSAFWVENDELHSESGLPLEKMTEYLQHTDKKLCAFLGHAGWSPGQLEEEIESDSWVVLPSQPELLSHPHDQGLWANLLRPLSPYWRLIADAPDNPFLN